jgi:Fe2+ or Zn2+ uptake regulation protein
MAPTTITSTVLEVIQSSPTEVDQKSIHEQVSTIIPSASMSSVGCAALKWEKKGLITSIRKGKGGRKYYKAVEEEPPVTEEPSPPSPVEADDKVPPMTFEDIGAGIITIIENQKKEIQHLKMLLEDMDSKIKRIQIEHHKIVKEKDQHIRQLNSTLVARNKELSTSKKKASGWIVGEVAKVIKRNSH